MYRDPATSWPSWSSTTVTFTRSMIRAVLEASAYAVFELRSPIGATRMLTEKDIKVVVIDVHMPAMNGDRLALLVRRNVRLNDVALILVSDTHADGLQELRANVGADAALNKRHVRRDLVAMIAKVTAERAARSGA